MDNLETNTKYFARLSGEQLTDVIFVKDYSQLQFGSYLLTVFTPLVVQTRLQTHILGDATYRDALSQRIACHVTCVFLAEDQLNIGSEDGFAFRISLSQEGLVGPEAITLLFPDSGRKQMVVI